MSYEKSLGADGWVIGEIPTAKIGLSDAMPLSESVVPTAGTDDQASRGSHKHPRLSSTSRVTLDGNGLATITYTRSFTTKPGLVLTALNPTGGAIVLEQTSDIMTGALYTGCTIKGRRAQNLPDISAAVLLATIVTALTNFNPLGASADGVEVSVIAIQPS